jgi:hypothetical protein
MFVPFAWTCASWERKVIRFGHDCGGGVMHKFKIGARLFPARSVGLDVPDGAYVVIKRLPMRDGEFEYQIKSVTERDERVVRESELRPNPLGYRTKQKTAH